MERPMSSDGLRSVSGRTVLITGAASGIGRATAILFGEEGASVAVTDLDLDAVDGVVESITDAGGKAHGWRLDVSDPAAIVSIVAAVNAELGPIDILVNNAGVAVPGAIDSTEFEDSWSVCFAVNLTAQARLVRAALPQLSRNGEGRVINVASTEGLGATPGIPAYTASKHGVIGLTKSLAVELGPRGVNVNCVCPGPINTGMTSDIVDEHKAIFARRRVPLARYGEPAELAHAILHLALPASSYINGAVLLVDGGMLAKNA